MTRRPHVSRAAALGALARRLPLVSWVPRATPRFTAPVHLEAAAQLLEVAFSEGGVRAVVSAPARHGKTELLDHGIAHGLARHPHKGVIIACHTQGLADRASRRVRDLVSEAGIELDPTQRARAEWRTREGGGCKAVGVGGALFGHGAHVLVIDDPVRSRLEVENPRSRDALEEWLVSSALTRLEPKGSALLFAHPLHEDGLSARLVRQGWTEIRLPAIEAEGTDHERALWPERYDLNELHRIRAEVGPREWAALFQCSPRPSGEALFSGVHFFDAIPASLRVGIGVDLAYSTRASSDYTTIVVLGRAPDGLVYVLDVLRWRKPIEETAARLKATLAAYPGAWPRWYASGVERALADTIRALSGVSIDVHLATADKATRAQATSAAWARGEILLPRSAPWLEPFVGEVTSFPGGAHDDQTDAFVAAYDSIARGSLLDGRPIGLPAGRPSIASQGWLGGSSSPSAHDVAFGRRARRPGWFL